MQSNMPSHMTGVLLPTQLVNAFEPADYLQAKANLHEWLNSEYGISTELRRKGKQVLAVINSYEN
jgi:hypothetical protein